MFKEFEPKIYRDTQGGAKSPNSRKHSPSYERETLRQNNRSKIFLYVAFLLVLGFFFEYLRGNPDTYVSLGFLVLLGVLAWVIGQSCFPSSQGD